MYKVVAKAYTLYMFDFEKNNPAQRPAKKKINTCSQRVGKKTLLPIWPKFFIGPFQKSKPPPEYQMDRAVYTTQEREREREREREIGCLTSHATIFQSYM